MRKQCLISALAILALVLATSTRSESKQKGDNKVAAIEFSKDKVYEFAALWIKPSAQQQLNEYFGRATQIALKYGAKPGLARFAPVNSYSGNFVPTVAVLSEWPSQEAFQKFINDSELKAILPLRDRALERLVVVHCRISESTSIELDSERIYEWAAAWIKHGKEEQMGAYFQKVVPIAIKQGGRPAIGRFGPVASPSGEFLPTGLTLSEWPSLDAFKAFIQEVGSGVTERDQALDRLVVTQYKLLTPETKKGN